MFTRRSLLRRYLPRYYYVFAFRGKYTKCKFKYFRHNNTFECQQYVGDDQLCFADAPDRKTLNRAGNNDADEVKEVEPKDESDDEKRNPKAKDNRIGKTRVGSGGSGPEGGFADC